MDSSFKKRKPKEYFLLFLRVFVKMASSVTNTKRSLSKKKDIKIQIIFYAILNIQSQR